MKRPELKRFIGSLLVVAAAAAVPAFAREKIKLPPPPKPTPGAVLSDKSWKGDPQMDVEKAAGYYIWQDDGGWHVRWSTEGAQKRFEGTVTADGRIERFDAVSKDDADKIRKSNEHTITFSTQTQGGRDGFDFRLADEVQIIRFDLRIDRRTAKANAVKLGSKKRNPYAVPFTIDRKDEAKKHK